MGYKLNIKQGMISLFLDDSKEWKLYSYTFSIHFFTFSPQRGGHDLQLHINLLMILSPI